MESIVFKTEGVCSKEIHLNIEDGVIASVSFMGGCNGSLKGIAQLIQGRKPEDVIPLIKGTLCGPRPTSCPDQLATALAGLK